MRTPDHIKLYNRIPVSEIRVLYGIRARYFKQYTHTETVTTHENHETIANALCHHSIAIQNRAYNDLIPRIVSRNFAVVYSEFRFFSSVP